MKYMNSISTSRLATLVLILSICLIFLVPGEMIAKAQQEYNTAFLTDEQLEDHSSMTVDEIRNFLRSHNSYFQQEIADVDGQNFDPSLVISQASAQYRINPQVILTTLQKENSGVTNSNRPNDKHMAFLMGCLTSNTARQQLTCAAERFRSYHDQLAASGSTVSGWKVSTLKVTVDGVSVTPTNKAVAGQFTYTPYAGVQWGGNTGDGGVYLFYHYWNEFGFNTTSGGGGTKGQLSGKKVTLDPGHSWKDSLTGAAANGMVEKDINLDIAFLVKPMLEAYGIQVTMTRTTDEPNELLETAANRANQYQADVVVSIHTNGGAGGSDGGTESCYTINKSTSGQSQLLGQLMSAEVAAQLNLRHRGDFPEHHPTRCDRYTINTTWTQLYIHDMNPPAAIIETAFIDGSPDEVAKLRDRREDFARAITDAVVKYFGGSSVSTSTATALVVDISGSMSESSGGGVKIESAKSAARQVVNMVEQDSQAGGVSHQLGLASFSDGGYRDLDLTADYGQARRAIDNLYPQSSTNMGAGLTVANEILRSAGSGEAKFIILLSDGLTNAGLSPDQILAGPVQEAVDAGTCIYTVGFGDPGSLDEDLLTRIANASGCGKYFHGSVPTELERIYISIRHRSTGSILAEFQGTVAQDEVAQAGTFDVVPGQGELALTLHWPGSKLNLRLRDPQGNIVDANSAGVNFATYQNLIYALIFQPLPGSWLVEVIGEDVPQGIEQYDVIVSARAAPPTPVLPTPTLMPAPQPKSTSGFPVALIFVVLGGGGVALYVYAGVMRRKRATAIGAGGAMAKLILLKGSRSDQVIDLGEQPVTIGRGSANLVQIPDREASRLHATIRYAEGNWYLQDQGSKTGSFVNNQLVTGTRLTNGDRIRLGSTEFIFRSENP